MTPAQALALNQAYREKRRQWAKEIGLPYPEDGGQKAGRGQEGEGRMSAGDIAGAFVWSYAADASWSASSRASI